MMSGKLSNVIQASGKWVHNFTQNEQSPEKFIVINKVNYSQSDGI
jgi:hypothetical protein